MTAAPSLSSWRSVPKCSESTFAYCREEYLGAGDVARHKKILMLDCMMVTL